MDSQTQKRRTFQKPAEEEKSESGIWPLQGRTGSENGRKVPAKKAENCGKVREAMGQIWRCGICEAKVQTKQDA